MKTKMFESNEAASADTVFPKSKSIKKAPQLFPVITLIVMMANLAAWGQPETPFFMDDFEDGDASDGNPVSWVPASQYLPAGSTTSVIDGSYVLTTPNADGFVFAKEFPSIGDVSIRAQVRDLTSDSAIVLYAKGQPSPPGQIGSLYWARISHQDVSIGMLIGASVTTLGGVGSPLNPYPDDVILQFDVVGTTLSLTAWRPGTPKPSQPQVTATAPSALPPGAVGFGTSNGTRSIAIRSFDATRIGASLPPVLSYERLGENVLRFQVPAGYVLQSSQTMDQPKWTDVIGSGSVEVPMSDPAGFFRLRSQ
jgi:hypothetical protein